MTFQRLLDLYVFEFKIISMDYEITLNNLQKRNDSLKARLIHEQLKCGNYSSENFKRYHLTVLNEYKTHRSFFKAASAVGISQKEIMDWYIQGQMGNLNFRGFFLAVNDINSDNHDEAYEAGIPLVSANEAVEGEYVISQYGDGWSYKTYVGGEKIFIISNELESLKKKVRGRNLPVD